MAVTRTTPGRSTEDGTVDPARGAAGGAPPPARDGGASVPARTRRPRVLLAALAVLAAGGVALATVLVHDGSAAPTAGALPATLAGLPAQPPGPAGGPADQLTARLAAEPSVADVAVRAYGTGGRVMVVLDLTPRAALTDATAGELTARVLGAAGPRRGMSDDVRSAVTEDGLALVTCSTPEPGTSTCVSVEQHRALVVVTSGDDEDPVERATDVRDEVVSPA